MKQGVALTGRNCTGPTVHVPSAHAPAGWPAPAVLQTTTDTNPPTLCVGGPVIRRWRWK